jgi:hypothetical protein
MGSVDTILYGYHENFKKGMGSVETILYGYHENFKGMGSVETIEL